MHPICRGLAAGALFWFFLGSAVLGCQTRQFRLGQQEVLNRDILEPSGIVYHAERGSLFIVGDEGALAEISLEGDLIQSAHMPSRDLEGITYNPETGLLYAIVEGENVILEITAEELVVQRTFPIEADFQGVSFLQAGNDGTEGITFIPDRHHEEGGLFYLTQQGTGRTGSGVILEVELPLLSQPDDSVAAPITHYFPLAGHVDLAGVVYDAQSNSFFIISDRLNELLQVSRNGEVQNIFFLPGEAQEGVAFDREGFLYVAQDSGAVIRFVTHGRR